METGHSRRFGFNFPNQSVSFRFAAKEKRYAMSASEEQANAVSPSTIPHKKNDRSGNACSLLRWHRSKITSSKR